MTSFTVYFLWGEERQARMPFVDGGLYCLVVLWSDFGAISDCLAKYYAIDYTVKFPNFMSEKAFSPSKSRPRVVSPFCRSIEGVLWFFINWLNLYIYLYQPLSFFCFLGLLLFSPKKRGLFILIVIRYNAYISWIIGKRRISRRGRAQYELLPILQ